MDSSSDGNGKDLVWWADCYDPPPIPIQQTAWENNPNRSANFSQKISSRGDLYENDQLSEKYSNCDRDQTFRRCRDGRYAQPFTEGQDDSEDHFYRHEVNFEDISSRHGRERERISQYDQTVERPIQNSQRNNYSFDHLSNSDLKRRDLNCHPSPYQGIRRPDEDVSPNSYNRLEQSKTVYGNQNQPSSFFDKSVRESVPPLNKDQSRSLQGVQIRQRLVKNKTDDYINPNQTVLENYERPGFSLPKRFRPNEEVHPKQNLPIQQNRQTQNAPTEPLNQEHKTYTKQSYELQQNLYLTDPAYIDLRKYLTGTFKIGYKTALKLTGIDSDSERSHLIYFGNSHPNPVSECVPPPEFLIKYRNIPPPPSELRVMLDNFVIYFGVRSNSELEKDALRVIKESFSKSERFGPLEVDDQAESVKVQNQFFSHTKICILRWKGVCVAKGEGKTKPQAQIAAATSLINNLAQTCYTVQARQSYYGGGKLPAFMFSKREQPGVYKVIGQEEVIKTVTGIMTSLRADGIALLYAGPKGVDATHINVVINIVEQFFRDSKNQCELLFGGVGAMEYTLGELKTLSCHVSQFDHLQWRNISGGGRGRYCAVSRVISPQDLCSFLLGINDSSIRYKLIPPQAPGVPLISTDNWGVCRFNPAIKINIGNNPIPAIHATLAKGYNPSGKKKKKGKNKPQIESHEMYF